MFILIFICTFNNKTKTERYEYNALPLSASGNVFLDGKAFLWMSLLHGENKSAIRDLHLSSDVRQWQDEEGSVPIHSTGQSPQSPQDHHLMSWRDTRGIENNPQSMKYRLQWQKIKPFCYTEHMITHERQYCGEYIIQ